MISKLGYITYVPVKWTGRTRSFAINGTVRLSAVIYACGKLTSVSVT